MFKPVLFHRLHNIVNSAAKSVRLPNDLRRFKAKRRFFCRNANARLIRLVVPIRLAPACSHILCLLNDQLTLAGRNIKKLFPEARFAGCFHFILLSGFELPVEQSQLPVRSDDL